ncbi:hypothetical protein [Paenibacillus ehimensis]|uniref:Uncharacterized protein n=1 Tax=Paenibacillus ehimensis TaxID=79264 RepID=A0ABT8VI42_9BACL|nr:hypothetical protein [Paenibacillus ehimensis]MDO3680638.1 hypothetical protein [Paenibacillus ehimensis]
MGEITLSTGKKVGLREKKGQHHFIERRLLSTSIGEGGQNLGGIMSTVAVSTIVAIESIDGEKVKTPEDLTGIYELMDHFTYAEWAELETKAQPVGMQKKLDEAAKNLQSSTGSGNESN